MSRVQEALDDAAQTAVATGVTYKLDAMGDEATREVCNVTALIAKRIRQLKEQYNGG